MAAQQLTLSRQRCRDGVVVVAVSGELDLATAARLDDYLLHLASTGHHRLVLNAARLTFCDAYGIRVLLRARARAGAEHGWLRLAAVGPQLRRIIEILELAAALPQFDNIFRAMLDAGEHDEGTAGLSRAGSRTGDPPGDPRSPIRLQRSGDRPLMIPDEFPARPGADAPSGP